MAGKERASEKGRALEDQIIEIGKRLGLETFRHWKVGRRIWGAERKIDVILRHPTSRITLGIECKFQGVPGSTEEKIPATIQDIQAWPIPGIVVFSGNGFSDNMRSFLYSTGKAVDLEDVEMWLILFFGLDVKNS